MEPKGGRRSGVLADDPGTADFLRVKLKPVEQLPAAEFQKLLASLNAEEFAERKAAAEKLKAAGERAVGQLRQALRGDPSAEQRDAINRLLDAARAIERKVPSGERLRAMRACRGPGSWPPPPMPASSSPVWQRARRTPTLLKRPYERSNAFGGSADGLRGDTYPVASFILASFEFSRWFLHAREYEGREGCKGNPAAGLSQGGFRLLRSSDTVDRPPNRYHHCTPYARNDSLGA